MPPKLNPVAPRVDVLPEPCRNFSNLPPKVGHRVARAFSEKRLRKTGVLRSASLPIANFLGSAAFEEAGALAPSPRWLACPVACAETGGGGGLLSVKF